MELRPLSKSRPAGRLTSLDALRGTVMIIMAIDHIRDFFDRYSMSNSPTDLSQTSAIMFSIRAINIYGDPAHWTTQKSGVFTALSFLNCTKYPASLDYVLMTIGPALVLLACYERLRFSSSNPLIVFGRVPLFYFVLHFYAIHLLIGVMSYFRYGGRVFSFIFNAMPAMGGPEKLYPPDFGYPLWVTYAIWIGLVAALYPRCRWFAQYKATHRSCWLSYL
jgi:uncharacterized membrane protein